MLMKPLADHSGPIVEKGDVWDYKTGHNKGNVGEDHQEDITNSSPRAGPGRWPLPLPLKYRFWLPVLFPEAAPKT